MTSWRRRRSRRTSRYLLKKAANPNLEVRAESEYQRLLRGRAVHRQQWREWARMELTKYEPEEEAMVELVRKKLNDFIRSIN
ncbi:hypothetical protein SB18R_03120 [Pseudomonas oryzihabitans]|nr:hypothetical protein SB9_12355 [Pseudomonas psychrotolerans]KTT78239.1 hypothetical protein SB18R_03120 [Pseudomonas psychrotolerans]